MCVKQQVKCCIAFQVLSYEPSWLKSHKTQCESCWSEHSSKLLDGTGEYNCSHTQHNCQFCKSLSNHPCIPAPQIDILHINPHNDKTQLPSKDWFQCSTFIQWLIKNLTAHRQTWLALYITIQHNLWGLPGFNGLPMSSASVNSIVLARSLVFKDLNRVPFIFDGDVGINSTGALHSKLRMKETPVMLVWLSKMDLT